MNGIHCPQDRFFWGGEIFLCCIFIKGDWLGIAKIFIIGIMNGGRVTKIGTLSHLRGRILCGRKKLSSAFGIILDFFISAYYGNRAVRKTRMLGYTVNASFFSYIVR